MTVHTHELPSQGAVVKLAETLGNDWTKQWNQPETCVQCEYTAGGIGGDPFIVVLKTSGEPCPF